MGNHALEEATTTTPRTGLIQRWQSIPLYARIVIAFIPEAGLVTMTVVSTAMGLPV